MTRKRKPTDHKYTYIIILEQAGFSSNLLDCQKIYNCNYMILINESNMIRPFWTQSDTASIVQPQPPSGPLFLRHFQPLSPPNPLHSVAAHRPSCDLQQRRDLLIPLTTILTRQGDHRRCQPILVGSPHRFVSLRSSPLPQQPAGLPLAHSVLPLGTLYRTTSPLRA